MELNRHHPISRLAIAHKTTAEHREDAARAMERWVLEERLGATVENQVAADRIYHLREIPAVVRFLSCEPLIEAIEPDLDGISWVICGGESGGNARMMDECCARQLRDQCAERGVAFFMKQMTGKKPIPPDLMVRQFPRLN